ncbi:hypothetical protein CalGV033 [Clostera anastomosis granulovirus A]|uniref:Uncharacterized protein n=1 Tax=Clostera anastomosis granulovirus A TaxID=1986289 RepID=U5KAS4_9BBAC|nr:hypothetical protein CalGV033 [Clostera anastomosis granulovirus Henan]AGQ20292.1 hypothetical protein CalGV033 [Clostera anastomosis granulovirus Henan]
MTQHLFRCEYDDLQKFEWCVILDEDTMSLWLEVSCLKSYGLPQDLPTIKPTDQVLSHTVVIEDGLPISRAQDDVLEDWMSFCEAKQLQTRVCEVTDDALHTMLEQFLLQHLPHHIRPHLHALRLTSLYDIDYYWNTMHSIDVTRKYWLLRLRVVAFRHAKTKDGDDKECVTESNQMIDSVRSQLKHLSKCNDIDKLHVSVNFNRFLRGSVGLIERHLMWS